MRHNFSHVMLSPPRIVFSILILLGLLCTSVSAQEAKADIQALEIGTYVEGTYFVGPIKKRFGGFINRTQGYAVTIVTNQLPYRRRITYESIDNLRIKKTKKVAVQYNPESRRFLSQTGVTIGHRAIINTASSYDGRFSGTIASVSDSTIILATTHKIDDYTLLKAGDLDQMSIKLGRTSYTKRGFKAGLVAGFCIGVIFSSSGANTATATGWSTLANIVFSPKTVVFTLVGATTGSIIGRISSYDTWSTIPLDRLQFTPSPLTHTHLPITLSYKF